MNWRYLSIIPLLLFANYCVNSNKVQKNTNKERSLNKTERLRHVLENPSDQYVMVVAHRGDWRNAPENSLQAIKNCITMGVDIVEIDVRMTKDSVLVLMHDKTIDRTTTGKGKISEWTLDSLRTLYLRNGQLRATTHLIPTLEEAMLAAKGKILINLDKCSGYMDDAYKILEKTATVEQAIFKGSKSLDRVQEKYGILLDEIIYMPIVKKSTPQLTEHIDDFLKENKPAAFEVIYKKEESIMFPMIEKIKKAGCRIWVNTLWDSLCAGHDDDDAVFDPDAGWGWVIEHGANIIQTDRPALLLKYLREKKLHD